ncbi:hypothetical protein QE152_g283 [Popillia japonica]|uniref:Uncharacterized protein n=1 Tax=Popillia japonica TaxID=7064 RepID=A0AAW1NF66_POPJA
MPVFEGDKFSATNTGDRLATCKASLRKKFTKTFSAVWFVIAAREAGASQACLAMCACKAFSVPRLVLVRNSSTCYHL